MRNMTKAETREMIEKAMSRYENTPIQRKHKTKLTKMHKKT